MPPTNTTVAEPLPRHSRYILQPLPAGRKALRAAPADLVDHLVNGIDDQLRSVHVDKVAAIGVLDVFSWLGRCKQVLGR